MGKKMTVQEIEDYIKENPNKGFDICSICNGTEPQMVMQSVDPDSDDFDLICDECDEARQKDTEELVYTVNNIKWDTDGEDVVLPEILHIQIPERIIDPVDIEQYISDEISDYTGFCHKGFSLDPELVYESEQELTDLDIGNILIALFLGFDYSPDEGIYFDGELNPVPVSELNYHESYDAIMPAVIKWYNGQKIFGEFNITMDDFIEGYVWEKVVNFYKTKYPEITEKIKTRFKLRQLK